jgi:hypothetical protein
MANTTSASLKLTVQATGENSGTWGQITNTNLLILEQAIGGYAGVALNATTGATLTFSNGALSDGKNQVLKLTGTITTNVDVIVPDSVEKTYVVENATSGAFTVTVKTTSGSGVTWAATDKGKKMVYSDGTNVVDTAFTEVVSDVSPQLGGMLDVNGQSIGDGTLELVKFAETASAVNEITVTNSATGNAPEIAATGDDTNIDLKLTPKGTGNLILDGIKFPNADGTAGQFLKTDGSGVLSFANIAPYSIDFLVVAGGGGGGGRVGGGGGAGGFRTSTQTASVGSLITVTVGDGGAGGDGGGGTGDTGSVGSSSSISGTGLTTITSAGGGGGGGTRFNPGLVERAPTAGGSGGGGGSNSVAGAAGNTPSTSPSQGNNGGAAGASYTGGGGGGAGAVGSVGINGGAGGAGGGGTASSITGSSVPYAGGGGGCRNAVPATQSPGGSGGGGNGGATAGGTAGTVNTGGGGGGSRDTTGAAGGKGVVILSVPTVNYSGTTTGSPTVTTSGANTIMQFNGSGSYTA